MGADLAEMLSGMPETRLSMSIPRVAEVDLRSAVIASSLTALTAEIRPKVSVVIGPPGSSTRLLCDKVAERVNGCAVDVDELLDKELERETEIGVVMHNMLAKGQVIPISITLQLLKNVCSFGVSHAVLENFPCNSDEIKYIQNEFVLEEVFSMVADPGTTDEFKEAWKSSKKTGGQVVDLDIMFSERMEALPAINNEFAAGGAVVTIPATTDAKTLDDTMQNALKKSWIAVIGLPESGVTDALAYLKTNFPGASVETPINSDVAASLVKANGMPTLSVYFKASAATCCERAAAIASATEAEFDADAYTT